MILSELHGKVSSRLADSEDFLTSNVFSFFKYSDRIYLKDYLEILEIKISIDDAKEAQFDFWPTYEDGTEPDLILICGNYYILFEAKYKSDFSAKTKTIESQIDREIKMGKLEAKKLKKYFVYVALTAEYYEDINKYKPYKDKSFQFVWTNWHKITYYLNLILENQTDERKNGFAADLYDLLVKKALRSFIGISYINSKKIEGADDIVFYNVFTSKYKGEFTGFECVLLGFSKIGTYEKVYSRKFFNIKKPIIDNKQKTLFYHDSKFK